MALLEVRKLQKLFGAKTVLGGVDFDLAEGEAKVVMGPSGCGKSTLLRCLNRLEEPSGGVIHFDGEEVTRAGADVRALRRRIGFVFQNFGLYRHLTVQQNVTLALRVLNKAPPREAAERALRELERVGMADRRDAYPAALSGGQSQRVAIARALAMDPRVLFFDEPTSALDPVMAHEVVELINQLSRDGVTILCVTHDIHLARHVAERVIFLEGGKVRAEGSVDNLRAAPDPAVRAFFGGEA
jgi:polar amino acid transport system ATP-binding protein